MSDTKHTPGPWRFCGSPYWDIMAEDGAVCRVYNENGINAKRHRELAEFKANAHLIAAAPDLLAILEGIVDSGYVPERHLDPARAAIAKARGRG